MLGNSLVQPTPRLGPPPGGWGKSQAARLVVAKVLGIVLGISAQCMVHSVWCTVYGAQCMVYSVWRTVYGAQCMVHSV